MKRIMYTALVISYIVTLFVKSELAMYVTGLLVIGSIAVSIRGAGLLYKLIGGMFVTVSLIMYPFADIRLTELPLYVTSTVSVVALLYMLPFINNVFRIGRYDVKIRKLLMLRMKHFGQLYTKTMFSSYLMSIFLFFAALPLVHDVIRKQVAKLPDHTRKLFVSKSLLRGFAAAEVWSPMEVLVIVALDYTGVNYLYTLPLLVLLSVFYFLIDAWRGKKFARYAYDGSVVSQSEVGTGRLPSANGNAEHRASASEHAATLERDSFAGQDAQAAAVSQADQEDQEDAAGEASAWDPKVTKSIYAMFAALIGLITVTVLVHHFTGIGFLAAVTVSVLPYALLWALVIRRFRPYARYSRLIWGKKTDGLQNMALLFLTLGIFNSMAEASGFLDVIQQPFIAIAGIPLLLFFAVQLCTLLLSFIGFHPLVSVSLFGLVLQPLVGEIAPLSIVILLVTSGLSTASSGTFNTSVNITAELLKVNPYRITWWNLRYSLFFGSVGTLTAYFIQIIT